MAQHVVEGFAGQQPVIRGDDDGLGSSGVGAVVKNAFYARTLQFRSNDGRVANQPEVRLPEQGECARNSDGRALIPSHRIDGDAGSGRVQGRMPAAAGPISRGIRSPSCRDKNRRR